MSDDPVPYRQIDSRRMKSTTSSAVAIPGVIYLRVTDSRRLKERVTSPAADSQSGRHDLKAQFARGPFPTPTKAESCPLCGRPLDEEPQP